jgi:predicted esterase
VDSRRVISAAVFTTQMADAPAALRAAVQAAPAPQVTELVACGEGQASSCDDSRTATCAAVARDERFIEYRGRVTLPVFQAGTPPYEYAGGDIRYQQGRPQLARTEGVCFTLTVPRGQSSAAGWPLVVYSHGTGGDHRNHVDAGLAGELAAGGMDGGAAVPMATLGYDGVLHGSRKGSSVRSTEDLVYNVFNPAAARDNGLQAATDLFALVRALPGLSAAAPLDAGRVGLYGHSQGGNAAAVAAGYEPAFGVVVLSGTGGGLTRSLLAKTKPVNVASLLPGLLGETGAVDVGHPVLNLLQMYFDAADPLNHGRRIVIAPPEAATARHLLHVFGADDHYAPETTQRDFGAAAGLPVLDPVTTEDGDGQAMRVVVLAPVRANLAFGPAVGAHMVTAVQAQYRPEGYDGHFVSTKHPRARRAIQRMLGSFFRDGMPVVE